MDDVHDLRNQYEADIGVLITGSKRGEGGFVKKVLIKSPDQAFAVVGYDVATGIYVFPHEIGHLLGAQHDGVGVLSYTFGHGYLDPDNAWRTVMAYARL